MFHPFADVRIGLTRLSLRGAWRALLAAGALLAPSLSLGSQGDSVAALREKIDRAERERVEICKTLGAIYEAMGDTEKAIESYRMGFQVFSDDSFLCDKLVQLYKAEERWGELVPVYRSLINANPGANEAYMKDLAECYLKSNKHEEAVAVIGELLDEYGEDAADYRDAAQMLMGSEQYEAAAAICRRGIEGEFGGSADLHALLGRAMAKTGKYDEAIASYRKAIELCASRREKGILERELAELCAEKPIIERVLRQKEESLKAIDERLAELYWQKALQDEKEEKQDAAAALYQKIVSLVPDSDRGKAAEKKIRELSNP